MHLRVSSMEIDSGMQIYVKEELPAQPPAAIVLHPALTTLSIGKRYIRTGEAPFFSLPQSGLLDSGETLIYCRSEDGATIQVCLGTVLS